MCIGTAFSKGSRFAFVLVLACVAATALADAGLKSVGKVDKPTNSVLLANEILNRWEPVAVAAGVHSDSWRDTFAIQLTRMDAAILSGIDGVHLDAAADARSNYGQFTSAVRRALMQAYMAAHRSKGQTKLGSATADQVFIPITPCRVVDSRNLLGPILAGFTRNYQFYASSASVDFGATQGGASGAAGTVCPETVNPNGGAPSAAVVTVTVLGPTAAGNFVMWGGASPIPNVSVLNWNNPGDIAANTTVVPAGGRSGTGPGGAIQDFAVAYNGPSGQGQVIVDVVGYFVESQSTAKVDTFTYDLGPGESSAPITVPVFDSPVTVTANCTTVGRRGLAQVTIQRTSVAPLFLEWLGISSLAGPTVVGDWYPGGSSPHIVWIDYAHQVELMVVNDSQFVVRSLIPSGGPRATGTVKLIR